MATEKSKVKKDDYQKALNAYTQAMKAFHKGDFARSSQLLKTFKEKYSAEKELVDRAQIYLSIYEERKEKEKVQLKTLDDYFQYSVYKMNQGGYEEALKMLEKARQMNPKEGKTLYLMAEVYCLMGNKEKCLDHLKKAIQMDKFFAILAQNENDFEDIREDKKFKLITRMV